MPGHSNNALALALLPKPDTFLSRSLKSFIFALDTVPNFIAKYCTKSS